MRLSLPSLPLRLQGVKSGGKGAVRRPKKVATAKGGADDKKLAATLKKLEVKPINGIEEVILHKQDGSTVVFKDPKRACTRGVAGLLVGGATGLESRCVESRPSGGPDSYSPRSLPLAPQSRPTWRPTRS